MPKLIKHQLSFYQSIDRTNKIIQIFQVWSGLNTFILFTFRSDSTVWPFINNNWNTTNPNPNHGGLLAAHWKCVQDKSVFQCSPSASFQSNRKTMPIYFVFRSLSTSSEDSTISVASCSGRCSYGGWRFPGSNVHWENSGERCELHANVSIFRTWISVCGKFDCISIE